MIEMTRLFADAWKVMVERLPAPSVEDQDGIASCFGNVPLIFLNVSVVTRPAADGGDLRELLRRVRDRGSRCEHPWGVVLRVDWMPEGWEQILGEAGLTPILPMTGMEGGELPAPRRPPAALEIRRVVDDATARDLAILNAHAYHVPPELFECICNTRLWREDSFGFVGYDGGKPVSCAAALPVAGTVYIALVATMPGEQGKGYAETVMRRAVSEGQQAMGTMRTTLHATEMGFPLYRAMGYAEGPKFVFAGPAE
jgi:GNAT superfamily N-acetyltransferase